MRPLILFGLPDSDAGRIDYALAIPKLGSLILTHDWDGEITGLKAWPRADWPNVPIVFWSFRLMVALGGLMVLVGLWSFYLRWRGQLYTQRWFARSLLLMGPSGIVALLAGWMVTEVGRQPYTVYGLLRTIDSVSPIGLPAVSASLAAFIVTYFLVFGAGTYYLIRLLAASPNVLAEQPPEVTANVPGASGAIPGEVR